MANNHVVAITNGMRHYTQRSPTLTSHAQTIDALGTPAERELLLAQYRAIELTDPKATLSGKQVVTLARDRGLDELAALASDGDLYRCWLLHAGRVVAEVRSGNR